MPTKSMIGDTDHVQNNGIGITVRHHSRKGASSRHAETARVVDDDQVRSSLFDEFGRESNP